MNKIKILFALAEMLRHRFMRTRQLRLLRPACYPWFLINEIESDKQFIGEISEKLSAHTTYKPGRWDREYTTRGGSVFFPCVSLYALVRLLKPEVVVETGGTPGKSSAFILKAMRKNGKGKLYTLDLIPPVLTQEPVSSMHEQIEKGLSSGWAVPSELQDRWELISGSTKETMPSLLRKLSQIDIFIHDSDHSYDHMMWEFKEATPFIRPGGLLLSDDIRG
ncbi:MAG: class I SAM-dependent methyltransferase, partial [Planctomycetes bacterium]|nr:class I SAM-dependent methyltransferase [Planctomycetota bacterium]